MGWQCNCHRNALPGLACWSTGCQISNVLSGFAIFAGSRSFSTFSYPFAMRQVGNARVFGPFAIERSEKRRECWSTVCGISNLQVLGEAFRWQTRCLRCWRRCGMSKSDAVAQGDRRWCMACAQMYTNLYSRLAGECKRKNGPGAGFFLGGRWGRSVMACRRNRRDVAGRGGKRGKKSRGFASWGREDSRENGTLIFASLRHSSRHGWVKLG